MDKFRARLELARALKSIEDEEAPVEIKRRLLETWKSEVRRLLPEEAEELLQKLPLDDIVKEDAGKH